jgi:antitoxin VapB
MEGAMSKSADSRAGTIKAKLFINGRSQAVRIPKELAFTGIDAVNVVKRGNAVILTPARKTWESFVEFSAAEEDFMVIRPRLVKS